MSFESEYVNLLIKQYWEKPKAAAEIGMKAGAWRKTFEWIDSLAKSLILIAQRVIGLTSLGASLA